MTKTVHIKSTKILPMGLCMLALAACTVPVSISDKLSGDALKNPLIPNGTNVSSPTTIPTVTPTSVNNSQSISAVQGDTMASLATRAGVSLAAFAAANGLPTTYLPQAGQSFLIPKGSAVSTPVTTPPSTNSAANNKTTSHSVKSGETAYSIARLYGVSVVSLASWNKLGPELTVSEGQELIIPLNATPNSTSTTQVATNTPTTGTDATPTTSNAKFQAPVSGTIATAYNPAKNSDGVVYKTNASANVKASSAGKVVLVSQSTGANGTIIMIQHPNGLISVYGKLGKTSVTKGQTVSAGDSIGTTAGEQLLFQLRKGTESVDPSSYI